MKTLLIMQFPTAPELTELLCTQSKCHVPCALVARTSCWCNGCSRLASANKYYERLRKEGGCRFHLDWCYENHAPQARHLSPVGFSFLCNWIGTLGDTQPANIWAHFSSVVNINVTVVWFRSNFLSPSSDLLLPRR